jgi:hypothetical protein
VYFLIFLNFFIFSHKIYMWLGRTRHRWENNIKMDLQEVGWRGGRDWIVMAQGRDRWRVLVNAVMNLRVP